MDARGFRICTPERPDPSLPTEPMLDLKAGYVLRSLEKLPRQGPRTPWRLHQNYFRDLRLLKHGRLDDAMQFSGNRWPAGGDLDTGELAVAA
jgi:hypothetical protein